MEAAAAITLSAAEHSIASEPGLRPRQKARQAESAVRLMANRPTTRTSRGIAFQLAATRAISPPAARIANTKARTVRIAREESVLCSSAIASAAARLIRPLSVQRSRSASSRLR